MAELLDFGTEDRTIARKMNFTEIIAIFGFYDIDDFGFFIFSQRVVFGFGVEISFVFGKWSDFDDSNNGITLFYDRDFSDCRK